ncbi:MAG TPA: cytidine deaminase [Casimicrobiaceae bacterium]|nr:cytidine deaminase [Casimicrobiaceae bacterium]
MLSDADWQALRAAARAASAHAHCPYSRFAVGAAVRVADGRIFTGCNVENASFGLTICAERNAVFQAVAAGAKDVVAVAVYTPTSQPVSPCGACRQVIAEFGPADVMSSCDGETTKRWTAAELLPDAFGLKARG